ncbi:hypothetical protein C8A01DRAFT_47005 [Parachaetomium inaequale]|uniref:Uncharacterized protein n=1 Tax=Parachaetomium inaequale TaxID=2588326 RepID=A0AAN6SR48_9PEZI|nr:hypothetical protein C8A01DRAFT_47005 [Parachaetomium inaequale]
MEPLDPTSKTPTRIPRPTFMAASPRTPSIRAVPYSHTDRVATASGMAGSYSPLSWPFPKSAKCSSLDLSAAATQQRDARDARDADRNNMSRTESMKSNHPATPSAASAATATRSFQMAQDRLSTAHRRDVSFDSVETQIYAPRQRDSSVPTEHPHPTSAGEPFLQPAAEVLERPMTPTPYSVLRKVSEVSEPGNAGNGDDDSARDGEQTGSQPQHQESTQHRSATHTPQGSVPRDRSVDDIGAAPTSLSDVAHATPARRDGEGRVLSRLHPLFRATAPSSESQHTIQYLAAPSSSVQAEYGGSDGGAVTDTPEGIIILKSAGTAETGPNVGASTRNNSLYSRRPTTMQSEIPDLDRLPLSPSMAVNAGRSVPRSTKKLWSALGRSRKMMLASAILLELSIINVVSSVTAVIASHIEHGYAGIGLVAWAAVSGVFVLTFGGLLGVTFLQYRKMNKDLVSGENWIEMHLRSRPLPPRPQSEDHKQQDNGATEAWQKFVQDHEQLRRYVEFLESRIGVLEEGRPNAGQGNDGSDTGAIRVGNNAASSANMENSTGQVRNMDTGDAGDDTPKAKKLNVGGSLSRRQLLQPEDSVTEPESWHSCDGNTAIPQSDTKTSILTELCEAVTEGYSPLSEQMPPGSPHIPQTPNNHTPSGPPRGNTLRHLALPSRVFHQRGIHSVDILRGTKEDI